MGGCILYFFLILFIYLPIFDVCLRLTPIFDIFLATGLFSYFIILYLLTLSLPLFVYDLVLYSHLFFSNCSFPALYLFTFIPPHKIFILLLTSTNIFSLLPPLSSNIFICLPSFFFLFFLSISSMFFVCSG